MPPPTREQYPPRRRAVFLQSYIAKMGSSKGAKAQADVVQAQAQLDKLLVENGSVKELP